jgi:hypothetical protein
MPNLYPESQQATIKKKLFIFMMAVATDQFIL